MQLPVPENEEQYGICTVLPSSDAGNNTERTLALPAYLLVSLHIGARGLSLVYVDALQVYIAQAPSGVDHDVLLLWQVKANDPLNAGLGQGTLIELDSTVDSSVSIGTG